jgi:hypothetical protein
MRKELGPLVATAIAGCLAIPATYALLRSYDVLVRAPEQDPARIVWSAHIAMFWRINIGLYVAGMLAPLVYLAARRDLDRTLRVLEKTLVVCATLAVVQGVLMP